MSNKEYEYIKVGVLTTEKKATKTELRYLTELLEAYGEFKTQIIVCGRMEEIPVEEWPVFDILIPYHLDPPFFKKAIRYADMRNVCLFNDLLMQKNILSREFIYETMRKNGIPTLPYLTVNHLDPKVSDSFIETNDYIELKGVKLEKPFVEKPMSARRHDVIIYYSENMGGGKRKLLRKDGKHWSKHYPEQLKVRRDGIYIYEKFVKSVNDIKVYCVLPEYAYTEERISPIVDDVKNRDSKGLGVRKICSLSLEETRITKKIIEVFKQNMCGFDMVRKDDTKSYVIDVNGMSFVKNNETFYKNAAHVIRNHFLKMMMQRNCPFYAMRSLSKNNLKFDGKIDKNKGDILLGVISIFRHGERTPKQKEKINTTCKAAMSLFEDSGGPKEILFKTQEQFSLVGRILNKMQNDIGGSEWRKIEIIQNVLKKEKTGTKVQLTARYSSNGSVEEVRIACKWGGLLTDDGKNQCIRYANTFKNLYKDVDGFETFIKQTRVFASSDKRVQDSARIFTKTFIGEKENTPKIICGKEIYNFFKCNSGIDNMRADVKAHLSRILNDEDQDLVTDEEDIKPVLASNNPWVLRSFKSLGNAKNRFSELWDSVKQLVNHLKAIQSTNKNYLKNNESIYEIYIRWDDVLAGLYHDDKFHASIAVQIYDYLKYDLKHNFRILKNFRPMLKNLRTINDFLGSAEYGITNNEKFMISKGIVKNLLKVLIEKLRAIRKTQSAEKMFLFFANKTLLYGLRSFFLHCKLAANVSVFENLDKAQFNYVSHIILRLYEDTSMALEDPMRFYVNIMFSPGVEEDLLDCAENKNFEENVLDILSPLLGKIALDDFCQVVIEKLED